LVLAFFLRPNPPSLFTPCSRVIPSCNHLLLVLTSYFSAILRRAGSLFAATRCRADDVFFATNPPQHGTFFIARTPIPAQSEPSLPPIYTRKKRALGGLVLGEPETRLGRYSSAQRQHARTLFRGQSGCVARSVGLFAGANPSGSRKCCLRLIHSAGRPCFVLSNPTFLGACSPGFRAPRPLGNLSRRARRVDLRSGRHVLSKENMTGGGGEGGGWSLTQTSACKIRGGKARYEPHAFPHGVSSTDENNCLTASDRNENSFPRRFGLEANGLQLSWIRLPPPPPRNTPDPPVARETGPRAGQGLAAKRSPSMLALAENSDLRVRFRREQRPPGRRIGGKEACSVRGRSKRRFRMSVGFGCKNVVTRQRSGEQAPRRRGLAKIWPSAPATVGCAAAREQGVPERGLGANTPASRRIDREQCPQGRIVDRETGPSLTGLAENNVP